MNLHLSIYNLLLRLYPRDFRAEYSAEMQAVFTEALENARGQGIATVLIFVLRELGSLPASLAREHFYAARAGSAGLTPAAQGGLPGGSASLPLNEPPRAWQVFMAALPNLLLGLLMGVQPIVWAIFGKEAASIAQMNILLYAVLGITLVTVVPFAIWKRRQPWSASWYMIFSLVGIFGLSFLLENDSIDPQAFYAILLALGFAFVLYYAARADRMRGILAALPFALVLWQPYMESTPHTIIDPFLEGVVALGSWFMLALVAALAIQSRKAWLVLTLAVLVLAISGALFAWLGTYQGGMQPFVEGAPSPRVTALFTLRTLSVSAAILLGPQLARCLRQVGLRAGRLGRVSYRAALAGIVLLLAGWMIFSNQSMFLPGYGYRLPDDPLVMGLLIAGSVLYTAGFGLLLVAVRRANEGAYWFELALVYGLIAIVPAAVFLGWPIRIDQPSIPLWALAPAVALWIFLSIGLVDRFDRKPAR